MSREYGMDPYDDSYDWQKKKKPGWRESNKPNGEPVSAELIESLTPKIDVVPEFVKQRDIDTAVWLLQNPGYDGVSEEERKSVIGRGLKYQGERDARRFAVHLPDLQKVVVSGTSGRSKVSIPSKQMDGVPAPRELVGVR